MSEQAPPPRRNKIAEEKERLRALIATMATKVPEAVNAGGIQTTRRWVAQTKPARLIASGGKKRMSRHKLAELAEQLKGWA